MTQLATIAAKQQGKKLSKSNAQAILNTLHNGVHEDDKEALLARLYTFFMPPIPAKPKSVEQWVAKAMAKKDVRYYLNYMRVEEGGTLVATDGHRLHWVTDTTHAEGAYDRAMGLVEDEKLVGLFPAWRRVIPEKTSTFLMSDFEKVAIELKGVANTQLLFDGEVYTTLDTAYLNDALSFLENPTLEYKNVVGAIHLHENNCNAVIMPWNNN